MNVYSLFQKTAALHTDKVAMVHGSEEIRYGELQNRVNRLANYFREKGLKRGDRAMVFVPMGLDLYATVLALFQMGAVVLFIDDWAGPERVKKCLSAAPCDTMICTPLSRLFSWKVKALRNIKNKIYVRFSDNDGSVQENMEDREGALITFTTGSTGLPKAADRTHGFLNAQVAALEPFLIDEMGGTTLCTLPIVTLANLAIGKTTVVPDFPLKVPKFKVEKMRAAMLKHKVSELITSPFYVSELCKTEFPETLKMVKTGGGAVFPDDAQNWIHRAVNIPFTVFYGSTECEPVSHADAGEIAIGDVVGHGIPAGPISQGTQVAVVEFMETGYQSITEAAFGQLQTNGVGEILVSGNHVLDRYIGLTEVELNNKIRVGDRLWHRTGDAGVKLNDRLFLYGRCTERIASQNGYVFPFQVEAALRQKAGHLLGTAIQCEGKLYLVLLEQIRESATDFIALATNSLQQDFLLHFMDKLPMDPRHHTKIDYARIREDIRHA